MDDSLPRNNKKNFLAGNFVKIDSTGCETVRLIKCSLININPEIPIKNGNSCVPTDNESADSAVFMNDIVNGKAIILTMPVIKMMLCHFLLILYLLK